MPKREAKKEAKKELTGEEMLHRVKIINASLGGKVM